MIQCSAIIYKDKVYVWKRHSDCVLKAHEETWDKPITWPQGIINEKGEFLDRKEAWKEAIECGQIKELKHSASLLYSEDLY